MTNPMLQMLSQQSRPSNNNVIAMLQNSKNPQELVQNMLANNPQITNIINQYGGGDPKAAFYEYARRTGQDPEQVLTMLKNLM